MISLSNGLARVLYEMMAWTLFILNTNSFVLSMKELLLIHYSGQNVSVLLTP